MKYTLYQELLDDKNILSHVFFNCANDFIQNIADKNVGKTKKQIEKRKIDIELKIDGNVCNPKDFFNVLYSQYADQVKEKAKSLLKEKISEGFSSIEERLYEYKNIIDTWSEEINWETKNPLK